MKKEIFKAVSATALCLGLFVAGFVAVNNIALASATEGTRPLQLVEATINIPVANVTPVVSEEYQKPNMAMEVILEPSAVPGINALHPEAAAKIGAQYIWDMFGVSIDGTTVLMWYFNHPSATRTRWVGIVSDASSDNSSQGNYYPTTLFTFHLDAITGKRINISFEGNLGETSEEARAALAELFSRIDGRATEEMVEIRSGGPPPAQLDEYAEVAKEFAQRHFTASEVVSVEFRGVNALTFELNESGNLVATNRQLLFEVTDSTGRIADVAIAEATRTLIRLHTSSNDIVPGFNYVGAEHGRG